MGACALMGLFSGSKLLFEMAGISPDDPRPIQTLAERARLREAERKAVRPYAGQPDTVH